MPLAENSKSFAPSDDTLTVVSIAALAFIVADLAHEGVGHGFGFYFAGGHSCMLTTTRLIEWVQLPDPKWRIFDLGGPAGNLIFALLGWLGLRRFRARPVHLRLFFWLLMAFSLFWAFGYLIFSGVTGQGDWMALIQVTRFLIPGRILFFIAGIFLYRLSVRLVARELRSILPVHSAITKARLSRLIWLSYLSGGLIACAGAVLDPRGPIEILKSGALTGFGTAIGLFYVARIFSRTPDQQPVPDAPVFRHLAWILAASAASLYFIAILGPGILMYLGD